ncbi:Txe/YoeB family addiction module toxin [Methylobacterium sp. J-030]|uniref:Txe/YoeB family addiction module toxin n=1 Tax=Methylobacterium sp. J-030 TaxID=2836627 RepID=UPI001FBAF28E|nr:Txe/YoeB family addiction module toxin [Methylobacterium sp. J-030]MCJ2070139.1 Txe/YoeB family addiction module toxin [Methylobacterium sp. J-030]
MKLVWAASAWQEYLHWQATDRDTLVRINDLINASMRTPFAGIGKVEPLRGNLKGWWSRRITGNHRLVYRVTGVGEDQVLEIAQCRWHYDD